MKKFLIILTVIALMLSFAACGKKVDANQQTSQQAEQQAEPSEEPSEEPTEELTDEPTEAIDTDPVEYGREYWEEKYPGDNICPFYIEENGEERPYYWSSGAENYDGTMATWIEQPFNWNGWHKTDDDCIVNEDETLKLTDDWAEGNESLSSFCTVTTEKYEKPNA